VASWGERTCGSGSRQGERQAGRLVVTHVVVVAKAQGHVPVGLLLLAAPEALNQPQLVFLDDRVPGVEPDPARQRFPHVRECTPRPQMSRQLRECGHEPTPMTTDLRRRSRQGPACTLRALGSAACGASTLRVPISSRRAGSSAIEPESAGQLVGSSCNLRASDRHDEGVGDAAPLTFEAWAGVAVPRLRRAAFLLTGDQHRADDVVQDVLVRIYVSWRRLSRSGPPDAYAYACLVNGSRAWGRRRSRREVLVAEVPDRIADSLGAGAGSATDDLVVEVLAALDGLGRSQRAVVVLRYWVGMSVAETARALAISEGNVKSQASRGLAHLRALVAVPVADATADRERGE
jgi:RNA polymerase sigma-70 factor (sigma-E family)